MNMFYTSLIPRQPVLGWERKPEYGNRRKPMTSRKRMTNGHGQIFFLKLGSMPVGFKPRHAARGAVISKRSAVDHSATEAPRFRHGIAPSVTSRTSLYHPLRTKPINLLYLSQIT